MHPHKFQKCDKGQWNPANVQLKLPVIDAHCHVFGQSLFEGSDLTKVVAKIPLIEQIRFFAYVMDRDQDNAKTVLDGIPPGNGAQNKAPRRTEERAVAAVPLLLDMGYTPQKPPLGLKFLRARGQKAITEKEQIDRTDSIRTCPDRSKYRTLRLETIYCKRIEDAGVRDYKIGIEVYNDKTLLKALPTFIIDHSDQTRQINSEVHFNTNANQIHVKLLGFSLPGDWKIDGPDLGTADIDTNAGGWKVARFTTPHTDFELTYSVSGPSSSGSSASGSGSTGGSAKWVLALDHLRCIKKHEKFAGSRDEISIEVTIDGKTTPRKSPIKCRQGRTYPIDRRMTFDSGAEIEL